MSVALVWEDAGVGERDMDERSSPRADAVS